jgi:type VI secretion system secreted protein VgrG
VVAARTELVGGSKSLLSAGAFSERVRGAKFLTAGATTETAGAKIVTSTKAGGKVSVGGSATLTASGPFLIEAPQITIVAASLDAGAFGLSGGALHLKSGKSDFKGTVKRQGGAKLEA